MRRVGRVNFETKNILRAYEDFLIEKRADGLSERTIEVYELHIGHFVKRFGHVPVGELTKDAWISEVIELKKGNRSDVTVTSYCRSIRVFLYWLQANGYMESCSLSLPKYETHVKEIYTDFEIATLLKRPANGCTEIEYQTWVFINFVMATGLRLSSVLDLKVCDYVPSELVVYIQHTKQKRGQKLQINKELGIILNRYIALFNFKPDDFLFGIATGSRMANRSMQDNVASYNRSRGVNKTSIHLMRHTFAVNFYSRTKDVYALKNVMGHSTITTTEHYLQSLGLTVTISDAYNPQVLFSIDQRSKTRRRGKI